MSRRGMTLLEITIAMAILSIVVGTLYTLSISLGDAATMQQLRASSHDEARRALYFMTRELRQSSVSTFSSLPANSLDYRVVDDIDGNGTAVDVNGNVEFGPQRKLTRDFDDANSDGISDRQLVMIQGDAVRVIANDLVPYDSQASEDPGLWFDLVDNSLQIQIETQGTTRRGRPINASLSVVVVPRN